MRLEVLGRLAVVLCLGAGGLACGVGGPLLAHGNESATRPFEPTGELSLENVNGRVTVETWNEPQVRIEAEKGATTEERLRQIRVEIDGEGSRVSVRTRLPKGGFWGGGGTKVDYRITVPAGAQVRVSTVNGPVSVSGVTGSIRAATTNGHVQIEGAAGPVEASTVNGGITAHYRTLDPDARHRLSTTNGAITVCVPEGAGGRLEARTVNGGVHNELRMESTNRSGRHRLEGRLGQGRGALELSTVNGAIHLRRG
jgi:DUF4097 and DUF4098 domain-containing protein YvlB